MKVQIPELLIAEDDEYTLPLLVDLARSLGWRVHTAMDGMEALEIYESKRPSLILSDIMMPRMDGFKLLGKIRQTDLETPFIAITAIKGEGAPIEAIKAGANDFIQKPLSSIKDLKVTLNKYHSRIIQKLNYREALRRIREQYTSMVLDNDLSLVEPSATILTSHIENSDIRFSAKLGLMELITNAVEHGNLEITADEKKNALSNSGSSWSNLVASRSLRPEFAKRFVVIKSDKIIDCTQWRISDQGKGFNYQEVIKNLELAEADEITGRGIFIAKQAFDKLDYAEGGRVAVAISRH